MTETQSKPTFDELYTEYFPRLLSYFHFSDPSLDGGGAEDLAHTTMKKTYEKWDTLDTTPNLYMWRIAANKLKDKYRTERTYHKHVAFSLDEDIPQAQNISDGSSPIEELVSTIETSYRVQKAIQQLTERQREVVLLRFYGELENPEIAQILNIRHGAVRQRLHNAYRALEATLSNSKEDLSY